MSAAPGTTPVQAPATAARPDEGFLAGMWLIVTLDLKQRVRGVAWYVLLGVFVLLVTIVTGLLVLATNAWDDGGGGVFSTIVFFVLLLCVRGLPALLVYRNVLPPRERLQMVFITATALPLLVALSQIGLANGTMLPENAAALVGAGALSVVVFPGVAVAIARRPDDTVPA